MSYPLPKTLVTSREFLQEICKTPVSTSRHTGFAEVLKHQGFAVFLQDLWNKLHKHLERNRETKYVIKLGPHLTSLTRFQPENPIILNKEVLDELIEILKKEYPGVDFTYNETAGYDGNIIERLIVMEWS